MMMSEQQFNIDSFRINVRNKVNDNRLSFFGKYGIGDACWALNIAHNTAKTLSEKITVDYYWTWDRSFLYSYDDNENIIDQVDYIKNFYYQSELVELVHHYNTNKKRESLIDKGGRLLFGPDPIFRKTRQSNWWKFNPELKLNKVKGKVVVWRSKFNSDNLPDKRKEVINDVQWDYIIELLKRSGCSVVELSYRTPVREAMYHINTCASCIGYAGMWYYFANNWQKPCIIISNRPVTKIHNPSCLEIGDLNVLLSMCTNYSECEDIIDLHCKERYNMVNNLIGDL